MHRFYCAALLQQQEPLVIDDPDEVHHIARVLRLRPGDAVELINGQGALGAARIIGISKQHIQVELLEEVRSFLPSPVKIILACALPKRSKFEDIIEKCTQLGVDEIVPLVTKRTEIVPSKEAVLRMGIRFNKVALSASKQCQRLWFPVVYPAMALETAVDLFAKESNALYFPWLEGKRTLLKEALDRREPRPGAVVFFIGPEGDFSPEEADYTIRKGAVPVSLGETVLRVETAAVAVISYAHFIIGGSD